MMKQNCRSCGYDLSDAEIAKAMAGEYGDSPASWGYEEDNIEWYCGDCYRSQIDEEFDPDYEVGWMGQEAK